MSDITNSESSQFSEKAYVKKKLLLCYQIISVVLFIAYIMELVKGNRTAMYVAVFSAILIIPVVLATLVYKKNPEAKSEELLANTENTQQLSSQTIYGTKKINSLLDGAMDEMAKLQGIIDNK